jgi:branched-subunit amino acid aminotransferase/4-amino-4-deoxychorismate lyase
MFLCDADCRLSLPLDEFAQTPAAMAYSDPIAFGPAPATVVSMTTTATRTAVMINGEIVDAAAAMVALDDGFVRGDGVFEGMRAYGRRPRTPAEHLDRLQHSADGVAIALDRAQLEAELARFCASTASSDCAIRLMVSRSGQRVWREEPLPPDSEGLRLLPVEHLVTPLLIGSKTLSYAANMQAQRQAKAAGCDEALLIRADDRAILEGPTSSFCWIEGEQLVFPPLEAGVLDSITRRLAVGAMPAITRLATVDELSGADGALLVSTVMEAQPVAEVAGVASFDPAAAAVQAARTAIKAAIAAAVVSA